MSRRKESHLCSCASLSPSFIRRWESSTSEPTKKLNTRSFPSTSSSRLSSPSPSLSCTTEKMSSHRKFPVRHVILLAFVLTLSQIPNANCQPQLTKMIATWLRARPPSTSFPPSATSNQEQQAQNKIEQQQQQQSLQQNQQMQVNPGNIYASSSEQLQNFMSSNNHYNTLSQGIPVVMPAQNSITIVTQGRPNGNNNGNSNNMYVAQPFQGSNDSSTFPNSIASSSIQSGSAVLPNLLGLGGQNLLNNNIFQGVPAPPGGLLGVSPQPPLQQQQQQQFPGGFILNQQQQPPPLQQSNNFNLNQNLNVNNNNQNNLNTNNNNQPRLNGNVNLPPPPPIPKNLKGPAIIAVPKAPPPQPPRSQNIAAPHPPNNFLGPNNFQRFLPHQAINKNKIAPQKVRGPQQILPNPANRPNGHHRAPPPILLQALQQPHPQLPSIAQGFRPFTPHHPMGPHSQEHLISLPENAILNNLNIEINKTLANGLSYHHQPQIPLTPQFLKEIISQNAGLQVQPEQGSNENEQQAPARERSTTTVASNSEIPPELIGLPRYQRKRQFKKQKLRQQKKKVAANTQEEDEDDRQMVLVQYQHHSNRGNILNKFKPTTRPTQIPNPSSETEGASSILNEIGEGRPSSTSSSSTDPPTPPNYQSMNALKYPSPFEDSAEVVVKNIVPVIKPRLRDQSKNTLHISPFVELKKRIRTGSSTVHTPTAADSSTAYRSVTTVAAPPLPSTSAFDIETDFRDTTTFDPVAIQSRDILARIRESRPKPANSDKSFRPSPQIHSFEEPVTGIRSYITILPPSASHESVEDPEASKERGKKSLIPSKLQGSESKLPHFEQGFKPVNHFVNNYGTGTMMPPPSSTTEEALYFDLIREAVSTTAPNKAWSDPDLNGGVRQTVTSPSHHHSYDFVTMNVKGTSLEESFIKAGWKVKDHGEDKRPVTTDSSERVEVHHPPETPDGSSRTSSTEMKMYYGNGKFGPPNCSKFHRFGFCPLNSGYPTEQVEKIASRCSALLSHLIAPLPKTDVRYDVIVAKNGSMLKDKSKSNGWSWKSFSGKPVCDTKEIKILPGFSKDENGEWLVVLQTKAWKQEAQITLCTPQGTTYNSCKGSNDKDCTPLKIKCVQRFSAQRLAVLDPENTSRCPVLRTVFLPSACVCLNENGGKYVNHNSSLSSLSVSSEELSASESNSNSKDNANSVKSVTSGISKSSSGGGKSRKNSSKGKSSKGRKSSRSKSTSHRHRSNSRRTEENTSVASVQSSEEEQKNKSGDMDTAADSSTAAIMMSGGNPTPSMSPLVQIENEEDSPEEDEGENDVSERPHAEPLVSSDEHEERLNSHNEVEEEHFLGLGDNSGQFENKIVKQSSKIMNTGIVNEEEDESDKLTTIVPPTSNVANNDEEAKLEKSENEEEEGGQNGTEEEE